MLNYIPGWKFSHTRTVKAIIEFKYLLMDPNHPSADKKWPIQNI